MPEDQNLNIVPEIAEAGKSRVLVYAILIVVFVFVTLTVIFVRSTKLVEQPDNKLADTSKEEPKTEADQFISSFSEEDSLTTSESQKADEYVESAIKSESSVSLYNENEL